MLWSILSLIVVSLLVGLIAPCSRTRGLAVGIQGEWPTVRQICRVIRSRQVKKNGEWQKPQHEVVYLVSSLPAATSPQALLGVNRDHWRIEIMHRNKDVILGEDGYTNRCDNAPRNIFSHDMSTLALQLVSKHNYQHLAACQVDFETLLS